MSEIGYGMWGMGGWTGSDDEESHRSLDRAVELGCNFFDTAFAYGMGRSEKLLGEAARPALGREAVHRDEGAAEELEMARASRDAHRRRVSARAHPRVHREEPRRISASTRLDLQQLHVWSDAWANDEGWKRAVDDLKRQKLIRAFGISVNRWQPANVIQALETGLVDSVQVVYNIFDQDPEDELFPACRALDVAVIARVPVRRGQPDGHAHAATARGPRATGGTSTSRPPISPKRSTRVERLERLVPGGMDLPEMALRFILANAGRLDGDSGHAEGAARGAERGRPARAIAAAQAAGGAQEPPVGPDGGN